MRWNIGLSSGCQEVPEPWRLMMTPGMPVSIIYLGLLAVALFFLDKLPATAWMLGSFLFLIGMLTYAPDSLISGTAAVD